jgi:glycine cleavage system H protein
VEVNEGLTDKPETINEDAYGEGWLYVVEITNPEELEDLLGPDEYAEQMDEEED